MSSSVRAHNRIRLAVPLTMAALGRVITATGEDIRDATKAHMTPGHFLYTGLSRDADTTGPAPDAAKARAEAAAGEDVGTVWAQETPLKGQVQVRTPWAALAELGTSHLPARPAMAPAIAEEWPGALYAHAREEAS